MTDQNDLQTRIQTLKKEIAPESPISDASDDKGDLGRAYELIATPIVCGAIGVGLDKLFSTGPVFFISLAVLGVLAAFWSIYKSSQNIVTPLDSKRLQQDKKTAMKAAISEENSEN